jgi:hypothetical protein
LKRAKCLAVGVDLHLLIEEQQLYESGRVCRLSLNGLPCQCDQWTTEEGELYDVRQSHLQPPLGKRNGVQVPIDDTPT